MRTTFLGTGGAVPTATHAPSVFLVSRDDEHLLFDYGKGTQRQTIRYRAGFGVSHLFVIRLHGDHILGIPGPTRTLDFSDHDGSLAIHGLSGSKGHLEQLVHADDYQPSSHISVCEIRLRNAVYRADDYEVHTFGTKHRTASVGYTFVEDDHPDRFDRGKTEELGVPVGPAFGHPHTGKDVELEDGAVVRSKQVVGDPRSGRTVVYTDDTRPFNSAAEVVCDADLFIRDATFTDEEAERAKQTAYLTVREAVRVIRDTDAWRFALTHIFTRYTANSSPLLEQACEVHDGEALIAEDGQKLKVPCADSNGGRAEAGE